MLSYGVKVLSVLFTLRWSLSMDDVFLVNRVRALTVPSRETFNTPITFNVKCWSVRFR